MANLDTFFCNRCGKEFVAKPNTQQPVCPACDAVLRQPAKSETGQAESAPPKRQASGT